MSQPALTRSVQRLEARLGAQLFTRAPRGVELTPIGAALRARVERARVALNDAELEVTQHVAGKVGKVRIGAGHILARLVSRSLFPRFVAERPTAQIQFHAGFNAELVGLVETGSLDFAVCGMLTPPPGLDFQELLPTDMAVVVRADHPLTRIAQPTIHDLAPFRSVAAEDVLAKFGLGGRLHAIESNSWEAILEAVAATDLFTLAAVDETLLEAWASRLTTIRIPELELHPKNGILMRPDAYISPLAARAIELIQQAFTDQAHKKMSQPSPSLKAVG